MIKTKIISDARRETNDGDDDDDSATVGPGVGFSVDSVINIYLCAYGAFEMYTNTSWY